MSVPFLHPDFELYLSSRSAPLTKTELPASSVSFRSAYGEVTALQFEISGETVADLQESGLLEPGVEVLEFRAGYAGALVSVAKGLLIWDDDFNADSSGDTLSITAYGCSQKLRESGQRTAKIAGKTIHDACIEVCSRSNVKIVIGAGAYAASVTSAAKTATTTTKNAPAATPATKPAPFSVGGGVTATIDTVTPEQAQTKAVPSAAVKKTVQALWQKGQTDWDFLTELLARVGYTLSESPDGAYLIAGPGLEIGDRPVFVLSRGEYVVAGHSVQGTITSLNTKRTLWGLPTELMVTGWEKGKPFVQIVKPEDLADRQKVTIEPSRIIYRGGKGGGSKTTAVKPSVSSTKPGGASSFSVGGGITAELNSVTPATSSTTTAKTASKPAKGKISKVKITKAKTIGSGAANFAANTVREFLNKTGLSTRRIYTGSSSKDAARSRALEALALDNLSFQETKVSSVGQPEIRAGFEVMLEGSGVPEVMQGKHLVRVAELQFSSQEFTMELTLNRNAAR
jgi:hypothetical protein